MPCERCGAVALEDPIHLRDRRGHYCTACRLQVVTEFLREDHEAREAIRAKGNGRWDGLGPAEMASALVAELDRLRENMAQRFSSP